MICLTSIASLITWFGCVDLANAPFVHLQVLVAFISPSFGVDYMEGPLALHRQLRDFLTLEGQKTRELLWRTST